MKLAARSAGAWIAFALALAGAACSDSGAGEQHAEGVVRGIDSKRGRITIQHEEIPGMMKAMTMSFEVSEPRLLEGLEAGDEISFRVRYADGSYTVTAIELPPDR